MSVVDGIVSAAEQVVDSLGYAGLALVMLVENVFPPIPSEVVLPLVGLQVSAGELLFWGAVLAATLGSVLGSLLLYALGRLGGRPMGTRLPRFLGVTDERLARTESWFARRGDVIVLLARLVPGLRAAVSIPAGTLRMSLGRFTALTAVGSLIWNSALIGVGAALGTRSQAVLSVVSSASAYALVAAAVGGVLFLGLRRTRTLRTQH
jgi:membrane protein DedA with SNARE-associated domain